MSSPSKILRAYLDLLAKLVAKPTKTKNDYLTIAILKDKANECSK